MLVVRAIARCAMVSVSGATWGGSDVRRTSSLGLVTRDANEFEGDGVRRAISLGLVACDANEFEDSGVRRTSPLGPVTRDANEFEGDASTNGELSGEPSDRTREELGFEASCRSDDPVGNEFDPTDECWTDGSWAGDR
jgi:hypothetical protein